MIAFTVHFDQTLGGPRRSCEELLYFWSDSCFSMSDSKFGFVSFAETWNGRLAMMGFVIGLGTELLTGQGILAQIGLS